MVPTSFENPLQILQLTITNSVIHGYLPASGGKGIVKNMIVSSIALAVIISIGWFDFLRRKRNDDLKEQFQG
jgi:hypothetical protein